MSPTPLARPKRSAPTMSPTPVALAPAWGCEAVGQNKRADADRPDRSGWHRESCQRRPLRAKRLAPFNLPSGKLPDRAWRSGQRRLSVGGAVIRGWGRRPGRENKMPETLCVSCVHPDPRPPTPRPYSRMRRHRWLSGERISDAGRTGSRAGAKRSAPAIVEIHSGKSFRDRSDDRVS